jgi:hypothetical protein
MIPSTIQKYPAKMKTVMMTTAVVACTSLRVGEVTLRISLRTSPRKLLVRPGSAFIFPAVLSLSTLLATTAFAISVSDFPVVVAFPGAASTAYHYYFLSLLANF